MDEHFRKELETRCVKKRFDTREEATQRLQEINGTRDGRKKPMRVYGCQICMGFHLTSIEKSTHRKVIERKQINISKRLYRTALYWVRKKGWDDLV